jgi:sialate O-acetylesterase
MNTKTITLITVLCILLPAPGLHARVKLPAILNSNMVLQQQTTVKLWGESGPKAGIHIKTSWDSKEYATTADTNGKWLTTVETPAAGGPYAISISDGDETVLENVLIGEVWFCSGQSNMEMPVRGFDRQPVKNTNDLIAKAKPSTPIRMFTTDSENGSWVRQFSKRPEADCKGRWMENSPENVANISAAGYFFATYIQEVLEVPVGIVVSSWGGSRLEPWMSREAISPFTEIDLSILDNDEPIRNPTATPCVLFNAKIAPLLNFAIKGFLWYQGESNRENAEQYASLMPAFVKDLRQRWDAGEFPFYFVQIAPYNYEGADGISAARFREVQFQNMKDIPNSGMALTMDIGHPVFIHPVDKETVGNRLAYWALAQTYGKSGFGYLSPEYRAMEIRDDKIYIDFDNAPGGICPMWTELTGFEIAGEDKVFHPAKAGIETRTARLAVSCTDVPAPVAVRYLYRNYAEASIFSIYGIPVTPFRTDRW